MENSKQKSMSMLIGVTVVLVGFVSVLTTAGVEDEPCATYRLDGASPTAAPTAPHDVVVIADFDTTQRMLEYFIRKARRSGKFIPPRLVIGIPSGITDVERRAVYEAARNAGAAEVYPIEEPMAAAIGAGLLVDDAFGSIIVDIQGRGDVSHHG